VDTLMRIEYCLIAAVVLVGIIAGNHSLIPA
jgi:Flp pilus assembly pilin Flp